MKRALTYDDILLVPKYSEIETRSSINLATLVTILGSSIPATVGAGNFE